MPLRSSQPHFLRQCQRHALSVNALPRPLTSFRNQPGYQQQVRWRPDTRFPSASRFEFNQNRFAKYQEPPDVIPEVRNPMNYVDLERRRVRRNAELKRGMAWCAVGIISCLAVQALLVYTFSDPEVAARRKREKKEKQLESAKVKRITRERLDAAPNSAISEEDAKRGVRVVQKPGQPDIKLDAQGLELVETGTSTIPYFPRFIKVPSSNAEPAATPTSDVPGQGAEEGMEEYSLLGLGIRTVSFLGVQVYVLGMYVRTTDLDKLQAAFVKHVNPLGSSLIPSEKESLKKSLMDGEGSLEIWNKVLQEVHVRSAVRIVPTRGTDFAHLRDGWVRGITARTQELAKKGSNEYDDDAFGTAMQEFKSLMGGKGKAPKASTIVLARDEHGGLSLMYEPEKKTETGEPIVQRVATQYIGRMMDERISRQVWLGYLGGKSVSSEGARKNIVEGVMELVERPVGTVGAQVI